MEASHVMRTLARWKWAIAAAALFCALLAGLASKWMGRQYTASVTLHIRPAQLLTPFDRYALSRADEPADAPTPEAQQAQTQGMLKTVEAIAKSPAVLGPVIDRLHLNEPVAQFQSRIDVKEVSPVLVQISASDADPGRATELATMVTEGFRLVALALRLDEARRSQEMLRKQLVALRRQL